MALSSVPVYACITSTSTCWSLAALCSTVVRIAILVARLIRQRVHAAALDVEGGNGNSYYEEASSAFSDCSRTCLHSLGLPGRLDITCSSYPGGCFASSVAAAGHLADGTTRELPHERGAKSAVWILCARDRMLVCTYIYIVMLHTYTCTCTYTQTYIHIHIHMHVHIHKHTHTHIRTYTHTHTCTHTHAVKSLYTSPIPRE